MCLPPPQLILLSMSFMRTSIVLHSMVIFFRLFLTEFHKLLYVNRCLTFCFVCFSRQESEFQKDIKALPERRRRTFLRYLERLKTG
jgi:hypothetical protein